MTNAEITSRIKAAIDQFYDCDSKKYIEETQCNYIGGILQCALFLLPTKDYFQMKEYVYTKHGYDPGGVTSGQIAMKDYEWTEGKHGD